MWIVRLHIIVSYKIYVFFWDPTKNWSQVKPVTADEYQAQITAIQISQDICVSFITGIKLPVGIQIILKIVALCC